MSGFSRGRGDDRPRGGKGGNCILNSNLNSSDRNNSSGRNTSSINAKQNSSAPQDAEEKVPLVLPADAPAVEKDY